MKVLPTTEEVRTGFTGIDGSKEPQKLGACVETEE